jgi:LacI family transcriptional regulator
MKSPTISDVAIMAGVSKSTVSAVLTGKTVVKESTRRGVLRAMDELHYRPSPSARRGFRPTSMKSLAFLIKEAENPYYMETLAGVRDVAEAHGYVVSVCSSEGSYEVERRIVELCTEQETAGLIIAPVQTEETDLSHIYELKRNNIAFVLLEAVRGIRASLVDIDNVRALQDATRHLIELGHSRIVHFAGPMYSAHTEERAEGMRRAFSASHLVFDESMIVSAGDSMEDGYQRALERFREAGGDRPTGATCYNDLVAIGVLRALRELGLGVPEDVSVVGCDDLKILGFLPVPLTTIRVPKYEMGRRAAEMVIRRIESGTELAVERVFLEAGLVMRESTRSLATAGVESRLEAV